MKTFIVFFEEHGKYHLSGQSLALIDCVCAHIHLFVFLLFAVSISLGAMIINSALCLYTYAYIDVF